MSMKLISVFLTRNKNISPKTIRLLSGLLLVLSPWILLFVVTTFISHNSINMSIPIWNDEISYWHEVLSFSSKGLDFGYYTINEIKPTFFSFGTHGFGTISVYAAYAKIFGWNFNSIVLSNNVFLSIAFLFFVICINPSTKKLLLITLFYLTYTPLILYCSTSMTELMNFAIMVIYFTLLHVYINSTRNKNKLIIALIGFCCYASFIRIIYILLFLPIILFKNKELKFDRKIILFLLGWIVLSVLLFIINSQFVSPFPSAFLNKLFSISNLSELISYFVKHFITNILRFIYPFRDESIQVLQRYLVMYLVFWFFIKSKIVKYHIKQTDNYFLNSFILITLSLLITFFAYDVFNWRDYRVIAPLIFGIVLFMTISNRLLVIKKMLLVNILGVLLLCFSPLVFNSFFLDNKRYTMPKTDTVLNKMKYTINARNRFENTVVVDNFDETVSLNTPAGIGITYSDSVSDRLQSKYIYTHKLQKLKTYQVVIVSGNNYLYQKKFKE